jgi:hypothetical protein
MKLLIITLAAMLLLCPLAPKAEASLEPQAVPFHFSSYGTPFAMQGDFEGEYRVYPESVEVSLTKAVIRISEHCPYKGRRQFDAIRFMLGTVLPDGKHHIAFKSNKLVIGRIMMSGDVYDLGAVHFSIPKEETTELAKHWFVVQMDDLTLDNPKGFPVEGYAFAQSCTDIFTQPGAVEQ